MFEIPIDSGKEYEPGDIIEIFEPQVHCIKDEFKSIFCDNCCKRSDELKKCSKCLQMYYCDKECQQKDWKSHKYECKVFTHPMWKNMPFDDKMKLYLRWWLCYDMDPNYSSRRYPTLSGSEFCFDDIQVDDNIFGKSLTMFEINLEILAFEKLGLNIDRDKFFRWFKLMSKAITFQIPYYENKEEIRQSIFDFDTNVGIIVVYQISPDLLHSCVPNASRRFKGFSMELRAIKPIAKGEKITLGCFINLEQNKVGRQKEMVLHNLPQCQCDRCRLNLDSNLDYEEFNSLDQNYMKYAWAISDKEGANRLVDREFKIDWNHILYLKAIFGEFHPNICKTLVTSYIYFAENSRYASKSLLNLWYKEIEPIVRITKGSDDSYYKGFQKFSLKYIK